MTLARFNFAVTDVSGNVVDGASISVLRESDSFPVQLFSDRAGVTSIGNPFTAASGASFGFHVAGGAYKITATLGAFTRTWRYVPVGTAQELDIDAAKTGVLLTWNTGTSDADPGNGFIRANNASLASATFLYVDDLNRVGSNIESFLLSLDDSSSAVKGKLILTDAATEAQAIFNITAVTDATGYVKVAVSGHSGATSFANNSLIGLYFARTGDASGTDAQVDVASATTTDIGAAASRFVRITGTTTITSLGTVTAGTYREGRFSGVLTLTHNATSLILPGAANIVTAANDRFAAVSLGSGNWFVLFYQRASGEPLTMLRSKLISATRDLSVASGDVAYTGVGFRPSTIIVIGRLATEVNAIWGMFGGAPGEGESISNYNVSGNTTYASGSVLRAFSGTAGSNYQSAEVLSLDSDGFTLSWTKTLSPTGVLSLSFLCLR